MRSVGVLEFQTRATEILRQARDENETVRITDDGQLVAMLVPVMHPADVPPSRDTDPWDDLERLAAEIAVRLPQGASTIDVTQDLRREL